MPSLDGTDKVVGHVLWELKSGTYEKTFLVLDFGTHTLHGYPGFFGSSKELSELVPAVDINCQWITKVRSASFRPRVLHCLEIGLPTGCQFFSVDSEEERDEWIESIRRCSRKSWKRRFFVLTEVSLGYYKSIEEVEPIRTVSVGEMTNCSVSKESAGKEHMFDLVTPSRTYYIQMETEEEMDQWIRALLSVMKTVRGSHQPMPIDVADSDSSVPDEAETPGTLV